MPSEAGTITLRVTLDEAHPAVLEKYSGMAPQRACGGDRAVDAGAAGAGRVGADCGPYAPEKAQG